MKQKPDAGQPASRGDEYAAIADEIRSLDKEVADSILKVLLELTKSNPGSVYVASKKYIEQKGLYLSDYGCFGILDRFLPGATGSCVACPGDIVLYAQAYKVRTDDVILLFYVDRKGFIRTYHARVLNFDPRGGIEVKDLGDSETYWVSQGRILGKLVRVISFGDPEWHDLIGQIVDRELLRKRLSESLKWIEQNEVPEKSERLAEMKRRLTILTAGSS